MKKIVAIIILILGFFICIIPIVLGVITKLVINSFIAGLEYCNPIGGFIEEELKLKP